MPAFQPNPEKLTAQESLGGGIREAWRDEPDTLFAEPEQLRDPNRHTRPTRPYYSRRGGRSYPEGTESELDEHNRGMNRWHTPEEADAIHVGLEVTRQHTLRDSARRDTTIPDEQYDSVRRGQLEMASATVATMMQAEGAAHVMQDPAHDAYPDVSRYYKDAEHAQNVVDRLRKEAEILVDAACSNCTFYERCALVGLSMHVVDELKDPKVREQFDDEMSARYGAPFVSCEYLLPELK